MSKEQQQEFSRDTFNKLVEFDWMLTDSCDFACNYCHPNIAVHKNEPPRHGKSSSEIAETFLKTGIKFHLTMSGGEPLLFPEFSDFCETITDQDNFISMNSNLSNRAEISKFANQIDPNKVIVINAALHKMERQRLGMRLSDFAEDVVLLQEKGFSTQVFYVLYPPLLESFEKDADYLKQLGVKKIAGKIFKGSFNGKIYPHDYTAEERDLIVSYKNSSYPITLDYLSDKQYAFKGKFCSAGVLFFKIDVNGNVQRCPANTTRYGNIYEGTFNPGTDATPCTTRKVLAVSQCNRFIRE